MSRAHPKHPLARDPRYRLVISYEGWDVYKNTNRFASGYTIVKPDLSSPSYTLAAIETYSHVETRHNRFAVILAAIKLQGL